MDSKNIFMIVLLLVILAIVYKLMQSMKFQSELTVGIAKKAGVPIPKQQPNPFKRNKQEQIEEEETEYEEEETEEQEETEEEETEEEAEQREEEENQDEREHEQKDEQSQSGVRDLEPRNHLKLVKPPKTETETNTPKKKFNPKKSKLKGYEMIAQLLHTPLTAGDLKDKWKQEYGETPDAKIIYNLNYALSLDIVKKHPVGKRFLYGNAELFEGDVLKQQFLPQTDTQDNPQA